MTIAEETAKILQSSLDEHKDLLRALNTDIHSHPELNFQEHRAHDAIVAALQKLGISVTPHAYGVPTSFEAEYGSGGRLVVFNAEYDALPGIGHACGHNLIAIGSISGFLAAAAALKASGKPGRVRLLGTPAEEGGCGKGLLISKGAFQGVDTCLMAHPTLLGQMHAAKFNGSVYQPHVAATLFTIKFKGATSHAAAAPWLGVNALDAVVLGYNAVAMMRQQLRKEDIVHGVIIQGGQRSNIIPDETSVESGVRAPTIAKVYALQKRVIDCFRAGAVATGCEMDVETHATYANLAPNKVLSQVFADSMSDLEFPMECDLDITEPIAGATDQGNVGCLVPMIHPLYGVKGGPTDYNHTIGFTAAAGTEDAFERTLTVANGLARTAWLVLTDDQFAADVKTSFEEDTAERRRHMSAEDELAFISSYDKAQFSASSTPRVHKCVCGFADDKEHS